MIKIDLTYVSLYNVITMTETLENWSEESLYILQE